MPLDSAQIFLCPLCLAPCLVFLSEINWETLSKLKGILLSNQYTSRASGFYNQVNMLYSIFKWSISQENRTWHTLWSATRAKTAFNAFLLLPSSRFFTPCLFCKLGHLVIGYYIYTVVCRSIHAKDKIYLILYLDQIDFLLVIQNVKQSYMRGEA